MTRLCRYDIVSSGVITMKGSNVTLEKIISRLAALGRPPLAPGQKYIGQNHEYNFICPKCGKTFKRNLGIALAKDKKCTECPDCKLRERTLNESILKDFISRRRPHLKLVEFRSRKDIDILYPCGHVHTTSYNTLRDYRKDMMACPDCKNEQARESVRGKCRVPIETWQERLNERYNNQFTVLSQEVRDHFTWLNVRCKCGYKRWVMSGDIWMNGHCPQCSDRISSGEREAWKFLNEIDGIEVERQFQHKDLGKLRFDFLVSWNQGKRFCLVEIDGGQHRIPTSWGKSETLEETVSKYYRMRTRDKRKDAWCRMKKVWLLRIPYVQLRTNKSVKDFRERIIRGLDVIAKNYNVSWIPHVIKG